MIGLAIKKNTFSKRCSRLLLVTLFLSGGAWAVDFKGIELGTYLNFVHESRVFGTLDCNPMQLDRDAYQGYLEELQQVIPSAREVCTGSTSIAAIPAEATVVFGAFRRVLRLTFQFAGEDYSQVLTAMMEKWGEGVEEVRDEHDKSVWWPSTSRRTLTHPTPRTISYWSDWPSTRCPLQRRLGIFKSRRRVIATLGLSQAYPSLSRLSPSVARTAASNLGVGI
jgi:hypothetical protein